MEITDVPRLVVGKGGSWRLVGRVLTLYLKRTHFEDSETLKRDILVDHNKVDLLRELYTMCESKKKKDQETDFCVFQKTCE